MVKHSGFTILSVFLLFLVGFSPFSAKAQTVLHVNRTDPTCSGRSPCFTTIQGAINAAGGGDVVQIRGLTLFDPVTS